MEPGANSSPSTLKPSICFGTCPAAVPAAKPYRLPFALSQATRSSRRRWPALPKASWVAAPEPETVVVNTVFRSALYSPSLLLPSDPVQ